jgi:hypothetical protein
VATLFLIPACYAILEDLGEISERTVLLFKKCKLWGKENRSPF